jgi:tRNA A-37 threonylcarbamoyl transferase component Bud32
MKEKVGYYRIARLLGQGASGAVYAADDEQLHRRVALKVIKRGPDGGEVDLERFRRETSSLASVEHANVVSVLEAGVADGVAYVATELVAGTDLGRWIGQRGRLPWATAAKLAAEVADGLEAIHAKGLVHGDLKPANVLVDQRGRARLTDFGLGVAVTPDYVSPEQAARAKPEARSDLYALGVVLFEMLTGDRPFSGSPAELEQKHLSARPMSPRTLVPELPEALEALVLRLLAKKPEDRPTAAALAAELRGLEDSVVTEPPRRNPALLTLGVVLVLGVAAFLWERAQAKHLPAPIPVEVAAQAPSAAGHVLLGRDFFSDHDLEHALEEAEKALTLEPGSGDARALRALVWRRQGDTERAGKEASEAIAILEPRLAKLAAEKRWADVLLEADTLLELEPDSRPVLAAWWRARGMLHQEQSEGAEALRDLERARALDGTSEK